MASREIGGIEVFLALDNKEFDKGIKEATKDLDKFEKEAEDSFKTLGKLEDQQEQLLKDLKQTRIGTDEYNRLRRELAQVNSEVRDLELGFEGLDVEQRASELKSVVGGLGDIATGLAAVSAQLTGADLEEYVKQVETVEKVTIGVTGAMESWASLQKLIQSQNALTTESFKKYGKAVSAASLKITAIVGGTVALGVALKSLYDISQPLQNALQSIFDGLSKSISFIKTQFTNFIDTIIDGYNSIPGLDKIEKSASEFITGAGQDIKDFFGDIGGSDFGQAFKTNFLSILDLLKQGQITVQEFWDSLNNNGGGGSGVNQIESNLIEPIRELTEKELPKLTTEMVNVQKTTPKFFEQDTEKQFANTANSIGQLSNAIGGMSNAYGQSEEAQQSFLTASRAIAAAQIAINQAVAISEAIKNPGNYFGGPVGAAISVAASLATVATAFASIPSFASGGVYRHSEAGQSEAIIPTNRMQEVFEGNQQQQSIVGVLKGNDIVLVNERSNNSRFRTRGVTTRLK